jgi:hypothetical protein
MDYNVLLLPQPYASVDITCFLQVKFSVEKNIFSQLKIPPFPFPFPMVRERIDFVFYLRSIYLRIGIDSDTTSKLCSHSEAKRPIRRVIVFGVSGVSCGV